MHDRGGPYGGQYTPRTHVLSQARGGAGFTMMVQAHPGQGAASEVAFKRVEILQGRSYLLKALQARRERMGIAQGDDVLLLARVVDSKQKEGKESDAGRWLCRVDAVENYLRVVETTWPPCMVNRIVNLSTALSIDPAKSDVLLLQSPVAQALLQAPQRNLMPLYVAAACMRVPD